MQEFYALRQLVNNTSAIRNTNAYSLMILVEGYDRQFRWGNVATISSNSETDTSETAGGYLEASSADCAALR
jgi:hypothetical protein